LIVKKVRDLYVELLENGVGKNGSQGATFKAIVAICLLIISQHK